MGRVCINLFLNNFINGQGLSLFFFNNFINRQGLSLSFFYSFINEQGLIFIVLLMGRV